MSVGVSDQHGFSRNLPMNYMTVNKKLKLSISEFDEN